MSRRGMTMTIITHSPEATRAFGQRLGEALEPGACIALIGPLGAGKTQMAKGIAVGAGVPDHVTVNSPTFVLVNEYSGRLRLYHVDAYRLTSSTELAAIGFTEMLTAGGAVLVEWADRVTPLLPDDRLTVCLEHSTGEQRRITSRAGGVVSRRIVCALGPQP